MPEGESTAVTTATTGGGDGSGMVPVQLAALVPTYDPAKDDITIFQQKVELLVETWPSNRMIELATRLVLNTSGTAFQKLQLNQSAILVNDKKGVMKLIELLGGSWGRIPLEKKFEAAEKAIYRLQQKGDEANDSYLARAEVLWQELLSKGMQLSELQAYIVLRGSLLSAEDKKKVILDSNVGDNGTLEMDRVQKAIRLLGAGFFQEMTSGKRYGGGKYKTYDNTALMAEDEDDEWAQHVSDGAMMDEDEALEQLLHEGDEDALMISEFEAAAQEVLQEDTNLASAFSAYTEARRKLSEKVRFRGFFPVSKGKGKPGNKGGKGKGFRAFQRDRKPLSQRILRSQCRRCLQFGHWKDECPLLKNGDGPSTSTASGGGSSASGSFAGNTTIRVPESLPLEFLDLQEFASPNLDDMAINEEPGNKHTVFMTVHGMFDRIGYDSHRDANIRSEKTGNPITRALCRLRSRRSSKLYEGTDRSCSEQVASTVPQPEAEAFISSSGLSPNHGILDTGATKTVIGSELVKDLLNSLDPSVRKMVSRCPCQVTFRFGNLSTLQSQQALVIPIGRLNLKVAVVPGYTDIPHFYYPIR